MLTLLQWLILWVGLIWQFWIIVTVMNNERSYYCWFVWLVSRKSMMFSKFTMQFAPIFSKLRAKINWSLSSILQAYFPIVEMKIWRKLFLNSSLMIWTKILSSFSFSRSKIWTRSFILISMLIFWWRSWGKWRDWRVKMRLLQIFNASFVKKLTFFLFFMMKLVLELYMNYGLHLQISAGSI